MGRKHSRSLDGGGESEREDARGDDKAGGAWDGVSVAVLLVVVLVGDTSIGTAGARARSCASELSRVGLWAGLDGTDG